MHKSKDKRSRTNRRDTLKSIDKERARESTAEGYGRVAGLWDRYWVPAYSPARKRLVDLAGLREGENVLDVGTGTGATAVIASGLVGKAGKVLAVDNSRGMLSVARRKARKLGLTNIGFRLAGVASVRLPDESFDAVISSYGMPDLASDDEHVLPLLFKALKPDGRLCFCERARKPQEPDVLVKRLLIRYRAAKVGSRLTTRRRLEALMNEDGEHFQSLYKTDASTIQRVVEKAGFTNVRTFLEVFPVRFPNPHVYLDVELSSWFSDEYAAMSAGVRREFMGRVLKSLERFKTPNGLSWDAGVNFCAARK